MISLTTLRALAEETLREPSVNTYSHGCIVYVADGSEQIIHVTGRTESEALAMAAAALAARAASGGTQ